MQQLKKILLSYVMAFAVLLGCTAGFTPVFAEDYDFDFSYNDSGYDYSYDDGSYEESFYDYSYDDGSYEESFYDDSYDESSYDDAGYYESYDDVDVDYQDVDADDVYLDDNVDDVYQDDDTDDEDETADPDDVDETNETAEEIGDSEPYFVTAEGGMGVFNGKDDSYLRENDKEDLELDEDEYLSYYVNIKNTDPDDLREQPASYRIDGGIQKPFSDVSRTEGGETQYHVDMEDMALLGPGLHEIEVFVDDELVRTDRFYVARDWDEIMPEPTEEQLNDMQHNLRSPYIVFYPNFDVSIGLTEYSFDLSIDKMDKGTYVSTLCGEMDTAPLENAGLNLAKNYGNPGGVYAGIQCWEDGRTGLIMTVWDIVGTDAQGQKQVIKATPLYKDEKAVLKEDKAATSGEGDYQQLKIEYNWDEQHPYRILMQTGKNEASGNSTLTMQVCDLVTQEWKKIVTWDLGYTSDFIKTEELSGFLENYETNYNGSVRSVNLSNIRGVDWLTRQWKAADSLTFTVNNSLSEMDYAGSYQFGSDGNSYYAITSGVEGLTQCPESGSTFTVNNPTAEKSY